MAMKSEKIISTPAALLKPLKTAAAGSKEYKAAVDALEKGYLSALKALSTLGIKMTTKKPDPAKLVPLMQSEQKSADFLLNSDGKKLSLTVEVGPNKNTLGLFDLQAEKDIAKGHAILKGLVSSGLADKADLVAYEKTYMPKVADPKVIANLEKTKKQYLDLTFESARKLTKIYAEIRDVAKKRLALDAFDFADAIFAKKAPAAIYDQFIAVGSQDEINIPESVRLPITTKYTTGKLSLGDLKPAYDKVVLDLISQILNEYKKAKVKEIDEQIAAMKKG